MKTITKTYKLKLKTNSGQSNKLCQWIGACRFVYNLALETKITAYKHHNTSLSKYDLIKQLPELKADCHWIKDVPAQTLQGVVERMDTAYQSFFRGGGFPRWAKKDRYNSLLFKQGVEVFNNAIKLPKIGMVRYFNSKQIPKDAKVKQATLKREVTGFFLCVVVQEPQPEQKQFWTNASVGLDMGVKHFFSTSTQEHISNPRILKQYTNQLRKTQRSLARKKKGSNNWKKTKKQIAKLHQKVSNVRKDFLHKTSTQLIRENQAIVVEDLKLKNMTKSSKGTLESPGKKVKQKSGLNRSLLDVAIGEFFDQLEYKSSWYGNTFEKVNPKYTSRMCRICGHQAKENRKITRANFVCVSCGHSEDADIHAAKNILARAEPMSANVVH